MSILRTPADLGNVIRQRRKALGWDQARLAQETGVSRQWVIDIEKGKPRAELQLVLRTLNVLGIELNSSVRQAATATGGQSPVLPDIDRIVENNRASQAYTRIPSLFEQQKMYVQSYSAAEAAADQIRKLSQSYGAAETAADQIRKLSQSYGAAETAADQIRKLRQSYSAAETAADQIRKLSQSCGAAETAADQIRKLSQSYSVAETAADQMRKLSQPYSVAEAADQMRKLSPSHKQYRPAAKPTKKPRDKK